MLGQTQYDVNGSLFFIRELRDNLLNGESNTTLSEVIDTGQIADVIEAYLLVITARGQYDSVAHFLEHGNLISDLMSMNRDSREWEQYRDLIEALEIDLEL
jgi:hypothetical protein